MYTSLKSASAIAFKIIVIKVLFKNMFLNIFLNEPLLKKFPGWPPSWLISDGLEPVPSNNEKSCMALKTIFHEC